MMQQQWRMCFSDLSLICPAMLAFPTLSPAPGGGFMHPQRKKQKTNKHYLFKQKKKTLDIYLYISHAFLLLF